MVLLEEVCDEPEMLLNEKGDSVKLWIEPTGRSGIKGTISNHAKGGLAVALAGHIASPSKSLRCGKPKQTRFWISEMKQRTRNTRFNIVVKGMKRKSKWFRPSRENTISTLIEGTILRPFGSNGYLVVIKGRHIASLPGSRRMSKRLKTTSHIFHMNPMDREIHVEEHSILICFAMRSLSS